MSHRIFLASDQMRVGLPTDRSVVWVHHKSERPPVAWAVEVDEFVADPRPYYRADAVVLLNLVSKIVRPGSRMKYSALTDPWNGPPRMSVDSHLFVGEPWRMWWHFGAVGAPIGAAEEKYHTSYRIETDWKLFIEASRENPCTIERVRRYGAGVILCVDPFAFDHVKIDVVEQTARVHEEYLVEKERAFCECKTPVALLRRLSNWAQAACQHRSVPKDPFASRSLRVVLTDLGIDRYLRAGIESQVEFTNDIAASFGVAAVVAA